MRGDRRERRESIRYVDCRARAERGEESRERGGEQRELGETSKEMGRVGQLGREEQS